MAAGGGVGAEVAAIVGDGASVAVGSGSGVGFGTAVAVGSGAEVGTTVGFAVGSSVRPAGSLASGSVLLGVAPSGPAVGDGAMTAVGAGSVQAISVRSTKRMLGIMSFGTVGVLRQCW